MLASPIFLDKANQGTLYVWADYTLHDNWVLSSAEDILIVCLPLPVVWNLQIPQHEKIELTFLFCIGCL